jgi:hypothetical protein
MSLRDYFAGQAIAGILANPTLPIGISAEQCVANAFSVADVMLAARGQS